MKKVKKAVFPVAGLGTRFLPATKSLPKEMLPIIDKPLIQFAVEEAISSGIEQLIFITGRTKRAIIDYFDRAPELEDILIKKKKINILKEIRVIDNVNIVSTRQKEPLGLGHAVLCAKDIVDNEPFAVILADDLIKSRVPVLKQLIKQYEKFNCSVIAVEKVPVSEAHKYGVVCGVTDSKDEKCIKVEEIEEKPEKPKSNISVIGRYLFTPEIFDLLEYVKPGRGGEIQLTDAVKELLKSRDIMAYLYSGERFDCGDKFGYLKAIIDYGLNSKEFSVRLRGFLKSKIGG